MSDLLNSASLVMIPSGYKEDVVYSQIPTSGSGDLSFTRASNGTRINSAGLVEVVAWNLAEQSEAFSNTAVWNVLNGASVTANTTTAPNGTTTADTLTFSTNVSSNVYSFCSAPVGANVVSVYAKVASGTKQFRLRVDLPGGTTSSNFTATTEWQRFEFAVTTTTANLVFYIINDSTGVAGDLYIWGAQLNIGSTAKPYFPTTDRLNVPRLTYQNGGGGCPSLLLEKQSTNEALYSEDFTPANGYWYSGNVTVSANNTTSPDGTQNADKITENTATDAHRITMANQSGSGTVTYSIFAKYDSRSIVYIQNPWSNNQAWFNVQTGAVLSSANCTASIQNMGDGWYRCIIVATGVTSGLNGFYVGLSNADGVFSYTGNGTGSAFIWGAQIEASSYPTSYIPTTSSSATRVADACFKTGISSLIGQTEGVLFADVTLDVRQSYTYFAIAPNIGSASTYIGIGFTATSIEYEVVNSGAIQARIISSNSSTGRFKIAGAYKANDFVFYINGTQIGTDTSGTVPTCSQIGLFQYDQSQPMKYNEVVLFPTRLTNAELASLTTI